MAYGLGDGPTAASPETSSGKSTASVSWAERKARKHPGIPADASITINGHAATPEQIDTINAILDVAESKEVADQLGNHMAKALLALVCANIGESHYDKFIVGGTGGKYHGIYQVDPGLWGNPLNLTHLTKKFLIDGGFWHEGDALDCIRNHPDWTPGMIAGAVEGSDKQGAAAQAYYGAFEDEAREIIKAYGGVYTNGIPDTSNGESKTPAAFRFTRPYPATDNPYQNSWECAQALANEVDWRLFAMSNRLYYFSEPRLAAQAPIVIDRTDPNLSQYIGDWNIDRNNDVEASQGTIDMICAPMWFHAGECVWLKGFGGGRHDRWIIASTRRSVFSDRTTLTLNKAKYPQPEPAHDMLVSRNGSTDNAPSNGESANGGYFYPMGSGLALGRTDMGVDFSGKGAIRAIGNALVTRVSKQGTGTGWPGAGDGGRGNSGAMIVYRLLDGSHKGKYVYLAENVDPIDGLKVGDRLKAGEVYAHARGQFPFLEIGWAKSADGTTEAAGHYSEGDATAEGKDFLAFIQRVKAGAGVNQASIPGQRHGGAAGA